jgi:membrane protein YdbS with pleckstrin-like domain
METLTNGGAPGYGFDLPMRMEPLEKLSPRVMRLWRIYEGIFAAVFAAVGLLVWLVGYSNGAFPLQGLAVPAAAALAIVLVFVAFLPGIRYRRWHYRVSDDEIVLKRGIVVTTHTVIPMIKIQYTDTRHGPIMRALRLSAVRVMTAGGTEEIPGLPPDVADAMANRITELVKVVRENV